MVLVKFKPGVDEAGARQVMEMIGALRRVIPGITGFEWGRNNSPEGWNKGLTHAFLMTFESAAARDAYLPHPEHEKVKAEALQHVEDACIFDFGT
jgi:hypothetical protein